MVKWSNGQMGKAKEISLLAMDVDGVLTGGEIMYTESGDEIKMFNILDGQGIAIGRHAGLMTAIISGRQSSAVQRRAAELGVTYLCLGCRDKGVALKEIIAKLGLRRERVAFVGDDVVDLLAFGECGWKVAVANASKDLKAQADYVTENAGGQGAIREVVELILESQGKWAKAVEDYIRHLEQTECRT